MQRWPGALDVGPAGLRKMSLLAEDEVARPQRGSCVNGLRIMLGAAPGRLVCLVALTAAASSGGCGGYTIRRPLLLGMDPCVEWVFEAPMQVGTTFLGPWLGAYGTNIIGGAAVTEDGKVIVLSNYGTYWAYAQKCNAYLLEMTTGRVLQRLKGPIGTIGDWYLDGKTLYVEDLREGHDEEWWSLDLDAGQVLPLATRQGKRRNQYGPNPMHEQPVPFTASRDNGSSGKTIHRHQLGGSRELVITSWLQPGWFGDYGPITPIMDLVCTDANRMKHTRRLGRLRLVCVDGCHVLINDSRRLLFCMGSHVICVDMRNFPPPLPDGLGEEKSSHSTGPATSRESSSGQMAGNGKPATLPSSVTDNTLQQKE